MKRPILLLGTLLLAAGCLFKGPDFFSIVGIDDIIPLPGDVLGRVTAGSMGIPLVPVALTGAASRTTTTSTSGDYAFLEVPGGQQVIITITTPTGFDCPTTSRTVTVPDGGIVRADFECMALPTTGTVSGTVTGNGEPLSGATVTLNDLTRTTDANGNFTFTDVTPGQKTLTTTAEGFECPDVTANVVAGETATSNIACTDVNDFTVSLTTGWTHPTGQNTSVECKLIVTTPAQPNATFTVNATGPTEGGPSGVLTPTVTGMLNEFGQAAFQVGINRTGTYSNVVTVISSGGVVRIASALIEVTGAQNTCPVVSSSARFKRDVRPVLPAGVEWLGLRPVTFRYRAPWGDPAVVRFGLLAEDVAEVFPAAVSLDDRGRSESIHYGLLTREVMDEIGRRAGELLGAGIARLAEAPTLRR